MADWLPDGWQIEIKIARDGSRTEYYTKKSTGQVFEKKEAMLRYANYLKNVKPSLDGDSEFKKCYMDADKFEYVDRPWEHDNEHSFQDYLDGKVGKLKDLKAARSSAGPTIEEDPFKRLEEISEVKAPEDASCSAMAGMPGETQKRRMKKKS